MKGRRRQNEYYFQWLNQTKKEIEALERLWELGVIRWRDERQYRSEIEPFYSDFDETPNLRILRVIR
jgi:hypothetical protein